MITSMHIQNFKCFKDFHIDLAPFNVLIGMNDTGKTAFLQAIRLFTALEPGESLEAKHLSEMLGLKIGPKALWHHGKSEVSIKSCAGDKKSGRAWAFEVKSADKGDVFQLDAVDPEDETLKDEYDQMDWRDIFAEYVGYARYYRFDPKALKAVSLVRSESMTETGKGLPTLLAKLSMADRPAFAEIEESFRQRFPQYEAIAIKPATLGDKDAFALSFKTVHGPVFAADAVSDGVILSLAFIALAHSPKPPSMLLIEEPENGIHYTSLKDCIKTLKKLSDDKTVQVILTTHSPYLLDCVEPEDVRVFCKQDDGSVHAGKLTDHADVEGLKKYFMTGEIWTELNGVGAVASGDGSK